MISVNPADIVNSTANIQKTNRTNVKKTDLLLPVHQFSHLLQHKLETHIFGESRT